MPNIILPIQIVLLTFWKCDDVYSIVIIAVNYIITDNTLPKKTGIVINFEVIK